VRPSLNVRALNLSGMTQSLLLMGMRATTLVIKFLLTLYIAKYLSLEVLGIYGLLSSAQVLLPQVACFGINHSLARHAVTQDEKTIVSTLGCYLCCVLIFYAVGSGAAYPFFSEKLSVVMFLVVAGLMLLENISTDAYQLLMNQERPMLANVLHFVRSALWAIAFVGISFFATEYRSLEWLLVFWFGGSLLACVIMLACISRWPFRALWKPPMSFFKLLKSQISESRFLFASSVVTSVAAHADRFIISAFLGLKLAGVYVFFYQVGSALSNLHYTGLIQTQRPKVLQSLKNGQAEFYSKVNSVIMTAVVSTTVSSVVAYLAIQLILPLLGKPLLVEWDFLLYFILCYVILNVTVEAQRLFFYSMHEDKVALLVNLFSLLVSATVLAMLLEAFSLVGAGAALVVSGVFQLGVHYLSITSINKRVFASQG
jgi:O-antigen/teichoic acid export membrane protein